MMKKTLSTSLITLILLSFSSCAVYNPVAEFTKQRYTNTVAYFNTFYNAQRLYSDAVNEMQKNEKAALEKPGNLSASKIAIPASSRQKFNASIEKNSKLLSYYPESKWVDDALLMIGKAYFYLDENVKAERKFLELFAKYPQSELITEAKLYYGQSLLNQNKIKEGTDQLQELFDESTHNGNDDIAASAALALGKYYIQQQDYDNAIPFLQSSLKYNSDDETNARTELLIGDSYAAVQNYSDAEKSYRAVENYDPLYYQYFRSQIEIAKMIRAQQKYNEALTLLNELLPDSKNLDYAATIHFEIANTYLAMDKMQEAIDYFVFVDTTYARTDEAARSYFTLATLFEKKYLLYDSAKTLYDKARIEFPQSPITQEATRKADIFGKYALLWKDIIKNDSLFTKNDSVQISIDTLQIAKRFVPPPLDTSKAKGKKKESSSTRQMKITKDSTAFVDSLLAATYAQNLSAQSVIKDSLVRQKAKLRFELAGLFYLEIEQPDSAIVWYDQVISKYPESEFAPRSLFTLAELYSSTGRLQKNEIDSIYNKLITAYPKSIYAQEARKFLNLPLLAQQQDSAVVMFLQAESVSATNTTEAIKLYQQLSSLYQTSPLASKALYAAGWIYENALVKNDSALAVYKRLLAQYPTSQYAAIAKRKINAYDEEMKRIEAEAKQKAAEEEAKKQAEEAKKQTEMENQNKVLTPHDSVQVHSQPLQTDTTSIPQH